MTKIDKIIITLAIIIVLTGFVFSITRAQTESFTILPDIYKTDLFLYNELELKYPGKVQVYKDSYGEIFYAVDGLVTDYHVFTKN